MQFDMETEKKESYLKSILLNVAILTKLYTPVLTKFRLERNNQPYDASKPLIDSMQPNYNYVSLCGDDEHKIGKLIMSLGMSYSGLVASDTIVRLLGFYTHINTHIMTGRYRLVEGEIVVGGAPSTPVPVVIIDKCPYTLKARLSVHLSFIRAHVPFLESIIPSLLEENTEEDEIAQIEPIKAVGFIPCIVCTERSRDMLIKPCNHLILCIQCTHTIKDYKCPVCNTNITSLERVYL